MVEKYQRSVPAEGAWWRQTRLKHVGQQEGLQDGEVTAKNVNWNESVWKQMVDERLSSEYFNVVSFPGGKTTLGPSWVHASTKLVERKHSSPWNMHVVLSTKHVAAVWLRLLSMIHLFKNACVVVPEKFGAAKRRFSSGQMKAGVICLRSRFGLQWVKWGVAQYRPLDMKPVTPKWLKWSKHVWT